VDQTRTVPSFDDDARRGAVAFLSGACYDDTESNAVVARTYVWAPKIGTSPILNGLSAHLRWACQSWDPITGPGEM
jgi:hypothetical protein